MRVALVHELLTVKGGAERVLRVLADMFPEAPIYTFLYDEKKLGDWFPSSRIRVSTLQKKTSLRGFNHHLYLKDFPSAAEAWDFSEFDLVISSSSAFAHGIITNGKPRHICYVHSPARYLWDRTHDVMTRDSGFFGWIRKLYASRLFHTLRIWDCEVAGRPDVLVAASRTIRRRIELYWRRQSSVVYPPLDDFWFQSSPASRGAMENPKYFLIVSTLARYKRIELAIDACNKIGAHLKVVGEGPDEKRLKSIAGKTVEFYGHRSGDELRDLYTNAIATIFPGDEDFGLVPLESMSCGTPVVAYRSGGALETVIEGKTGEFFDLASAECLAETIGKFSPEKYSKETCRNRALGFSRTEFEKAIRATIAQTTI